MARDFDSIDAKRLIDEHKSLLKRLEAVEKHVRPLQSEVKQAIDALIVSEIQRILKDIPVEEINRDKRGFRVKALTDAGYESIADVSAASVRELEKINGISQDAARAIKQAANEIAVVAKKSVKIRLNVDDKSPEASRVVLSLLKLMECEPCIRLCRDLHKTNQKTVSYAVADLAPATSGLKWFFTGRTKKERAITAYETLMKLSEGEYFQGMSQNLDSLESRLGTTAEEAWQSFSADPIRFFNALERICPGVMGDNDSVYGLPEELAHTIEGQNFLSEGLNCELRRYQEWGVKYILHQEKVLLGDEMGLGKTIQAIAAMVSLCNTGASHFVVVCPASVLTNWCREVQKMSTLPVIKVHGSDRDEALEHWKRNGGVAVTTYETTGHFQLGEKFHFSLLIVDEAHYIKNPEAQRTKFVKKIGEHAERMLFMTGTALENRVDEMIELIKILQPDVAESVQGMEFLSSAPQFREKVAPVYYRRRREDVLTELPDLIETKEWCTMTAEEEEVYEEAVLNKRYTEARRVSWNVDDLSASSKAERMLELLEEAKEEGRKAIVFSFFLDTIQKVQSLLGDRCIGPITGAVSPQKRQELVDEFNAAPVGSVLLAQIQAGGTGLNIQSASVIILCEPQFKPSIENQAISRAYRMGQTRNVLVYRLLCDETVDERITDLLESKQAIFDAFADESVAADKSLELEDKAFGNIIQEEIDRINAKRGNSDTPTTDSLGTAEE
ncbi:MAG: DEAD/DEAH box helicase [Ruminococcaceae bacterium]|nr:DEAD/DEAH box helicase [Oscillospiraceae bacterium]